MLSGFVRSIPCQGCQRPRVYGRCIERLKTPNQPHSFQLRTSNVTLLTRQKDTG